MGELGSSAGDKRLQIVHLEITDIGATASPALNYKLSILINLLEL